MKKLICMFCAVALLALSLFSCGKETNSQLSNDNVVDDYINYTITKNADYVATTPNDLYNIADVVVVGSFGKTTSTYVCANSLPVTQVVFNVDNVKKGEVTKKDIIVEYYGGTVTMESYIKTLTTAQIAKRGLNVSSAEISRMTVTYGVTEESVVVNNSDTYMLFLSYDAKKGTYFILSDAYGACKMNNNLIYSLSEEKFITPNFTKDIIE